jgi:hypothetical protein
MPQTEVWADQRNKAARVLVRAALRLQPSPDAVLLSAFPSTSRNRPARLPPPAPPRHIWSMDQEREDYADPRPPPEWFTFATHKGTIAVVCLAVRFALARAIYVRYAIGPLRLAPARPAVKCLLQLTDSVHYVSGVTSGRSVPRTTAAGPAARRPRIHLRPGPSRRPPRSR